MNVTSKPTHDIALVLDTNIVLDWLVFRDPMLDTLRESVQRGVRVLASLRALEELERVLAYPQLKLKYTVQQLMLAEYRSYATLLTDVAPPTGLPRCRDGDDQHFLELAAFAGADFLVSRDKALLKLRSKMKRFGVDVVDAQEAIRRLVAHGT